MKPIEKDLMTGMISILNQAIESKNNGTPIMEDKYMDVRLADLKEFEDETGVIFVNSPHCKFDMESIIDIKAINDNSLKECEDISEIVEYSNQKEMIAYLDIVGLNLIVTYTDGFLTNIQTNDVNIKKKIRFLNLPYKIKKDGTYVVKGKIPFAKEPIFYADDILEGGIGNFNDDLNEAKDLNFDIAPFWFAKNLSSKKLQSTVDYVIENINEYDFQCNGIVFKFNEKEFSNVLNFAGCSYAKLINI